MRSPVLTSLICMVHNNFCTKGNKVLLYFSLSKFSLSNLSTPQFYLHDIFKVNSYIQIKSFLLEFSSDGIFLVMINSTYR